MVLIREYQHLGRYATEFCGIESHLTLRGEDAVVKFSVGNHDWSVPFVDETMG